MKRLIELVKYAETEAKELPFAVYTSFKEQRILNVPVMKPLLIFILSGVKRLGSESNIICNAGDFVFLSNSPTIDMRNIPNDKEYCALLIEFDSQDFSDFKDDRNIKTRWRRHRKFIQGKIDTGLERTLFQFVEWSMFAPSDMWRLRKQELLHFIYHLGYKEVSSLVESLSITHQVHDIICEHISEEMSNKMISDQLAMSESTLRRRLKHEGVTMREIKDRARLGHGLHLIQTTIDPIGLIAQRCGYQSQSRFTDRFKQMFSLTPSELRKTKMVD